MDIRTFIDLVERTLPSSAMEVEDLLMRHGWEKVGSGYYAEVYSKPHMNYVVKVFERDSGYSAYLNLISQHPNRHFPKVKGKIWLSETYTGVRLEKLLPMQPVIVDGYSLPLDALLNAFLIEKRHKLNDIQERYLEQAKEYLSDKPEFVDALNLISDTLLDHYGLDISRNNIMMRPDGTPVIIDPVYS